MLRKIMSSLMEKPTKDVNDSELAEFTEVSAATISNFFAYKRELSIPTWILAVKKLDPTREDEVMDILIPATIESEDREKCRHIMEYASTKRRFDLLEMIITSQKKAPRENKDWANLYEISLLFQKREVPNDVLLEMLERYLPKTNETKVFHNILKASVYYMLKEYKSMFRVAKLAEKGLEDITSPYIKENYSARLADLYSLAYLYLRNDIKKSRYFAKAVINSRFLCAKYYSHMYHLLGTSYLFESYEESYRYFMKYYTTLLSQGRDDLANQTLNLDIYFCKVLWRKLSDSFKTSDPVERMHYLARNGGIEEFNKLYNCVKKDDPFVMCYRGMITKNPNLIQESLLTFVNSGNKFFAELPKRELESYAGFEVFARAFDKINIA